MSEKDIQARIFDRLVELQWFVKILHGCAFQVGMPDMFAARIDKGYRFIEVKKPYGKCKFQPSQLKTFPLMEKQGVGVWILSNFDDNAIRLLDGPANYKDFLLKHEFGVW